LQKAAIFEVVPSGEEDAGLLVTPSADAKTALEKFIEAIGKHRHPQRDSDPPRV
jgi:catalase